MVLQISLLLYLVNTVGCFDAPGGFIMESRTAFERSSFLLSIIEEDWLIHKNMGCLSFGKKKANVTSHKHQGWKKLTNKWGC